MTLLGKLGAGGFLCHLGSAMPGLPGASAHYQLPLCLLLFRRENPFFSWMFLSDANQLLELRNGLDPPAKAAQAPTSPWAHFLKGSPQPDKNTQ